MGTNSFCSSINDPNPYSSNNDPYTPPTTWHAGPPPTHPPTPRHTSPPMPPPPLLQGEEDDSFSLMTAKDQAKLKKWVSGF